MLRIVVVSVSISPPALVNTKLPVVVVIVLSVATPIVMLPKSAPGAVTVPPAVSALLTVVVPEAAPMFTAVAARPRLMVVALAGKMLPVVAVVRMLPDKTYKSPRTITLPELSGMGVPASPYKLVELLELEFCVVTEPYKLEELVMCDPYLIEYWRYCLGCQTLVSRVCPPDHLPKLF